MPAPLLSFYGDDFTGSSAVMEVLSFAGISTMLFMEVPTGEVLSRFPDLRAVGVAGIARSKKPEWMRANLPPIFEGLKRLGAPLTHYKVCSTFDSAPEIGSIGIAAEIGRQVFEPDWIPLVVGAPAIGRYQVFGNLFAAADNVIHRLDRHPVMSHHPATPMDEADLGLHLSRQTSLKTGCVDFLAMTTGRVDVALESVISDGSSIVAIDAMDDATLRIAGRMISESGVTFAIGSQGIEYALVAHMRETGQLPAEYPSPKLSSVEQLFAVSGSCAPTTAAQIDCAEEHGFAIIDFDAAMATDKSALMSETARLREKSLKLLSDGRDVLVTTSRGPNDPSVARMKDAIVSAGLSKPKVNEQLGRALGNLISEIRLKTGMPRVAIGGGDTSGHALSEFRTEALSTVAPLAPGAPLCRVHSAQDSKIDGLEVTLKGGQMGAPEFFVHAKTGNA